MVRRGKRRDASRSVVVPQRMGVAFGFSRLANLPVQSDPLFARSRAVCFDVGDQTLLLTR
jgi:hypothetical protein